MADPEPELVPLRLESIRIAFFQLGDRVNGALHTQIGDRLRLQEQNSGVLRLLAAIHEHSDVIPPAERQVMESSIENMLDALSTATLQSDDIPSGPGISVSRPPSGSNFVVRPVLPPVAGVASRTIRRRALEYGLVEPAAPVFIEDVDEAGVVVRTYITSTTGPVSEISDDELDELMHYILEIFPTFGRRMIAGHLRQLGHHIPTARIRESYNRVHGPPVSYSSHPTGRQPYRVAGPNSLSHHDGQHGLRRWRIIIHAFIDGFSRFVTGIRANNNNRAATVLDLFLQDVLLHGVPRRVRGDHGTENVAVAQWMEEHYGPEHGAYIWGRSVHNIRIERLWCDVTRGFGRKWSHFFLGLELNCGLRPDLDAHIWLIHHLFLPAINEDAQDWARTWNEHKIRLETERTRSPRDMFFFGMIENGLRGFEGVPEVLDDDEIENLDGYGVDWVDLSDPEVMAHHDEFNTDPELNMDSIQNPFTNDGPHQLSHVEVVEPLCPFDPAEVELLDAHLARSAHFYSRNMNSRRALWIEALDFCRQLYEQ
ncbi:Integrase catalytic domain-containing protein [Mycena sanguinolenta]|uniref:Integrase catalytic domain-containing protein n=1 Tax=Mycena sanguinolenta TaxID=230812 RepID=A0A8H6YIB0_9AGAR|nr:Integrase catalytic domain-containing protein [Mycena sanguinolenta]